MHSFSSVSALLIADNYRKFAAIMAGLIALGFTYSVMPSVDGVAHMFEQETEGVSVLVEGDTFSILFPDSSLIVSADDVLNYIDKSV